MLPLGLNDWNWGTEELKNFRTEENEELRN
jgi:hypothetical protein